MAASELLNLPHITTKTPQAISFGSEPRSPTSVLHDQGFDPTEHKHETEPIIMRKQSMGGRRKQMRRRRNVVVGSKSLSNLENEELKGFMDLGFVFHKDDRKSRLVKIVPGLRRFGDGDGDDNDEDESRADVSRPYLSEAWDAIEKRDELMNQRDWDLSDENEMKNRIKVWAHCVAASVR